ncbi:hypothetical protein HYX14_03180 [Candidatus Woesearchaeota archaeon]|nr:hypothetical protein [Candidatus Woesearchaeota archaeon]
MEKGQDLGMYSVQKSSFRVFDQEGEKFIEKKIRLQALKEHQHSIQGMIKTYAAKIREAGILFPRIVSVDPDRCQYTCEYQGENLLQACPRPHDILENLNLDAILDILRLAQLRCLGLDPHIKNFVVGRSGVHYVDFSPPLIEDYFALRLSLCSPAEREILQVNFDYFKSPLLGYHFAGDLLKMDEQFYSEMPLLFERLARRKIVGENYADFLAKAEKIKEIERTRDRMGILLL